MVKHDSEWFRKQAIAKRERNSGMQSYEMNRRKRDMEELESIYRQIRKEDANK